MDLILAAGFVLILSVCTGLVVHEGAHAAALRFGRIDYSVTYFPGRKHGLCSAAIGRPWAVVEPVLTGREPAWVLRAAALAPFALCLPLVAVVATGVVSLEQPLVAAFAIGWLACALPSPQDFSVAFYAHQLLADQLDERPIRNTSTGRPKGTRRTKGTGWTKGE